MGRDLGTFHKEVTKMEHDHKYFSESVNNTYRCTAEQQYLWKLCSNNESPDYRIIKRFNIKGDLDKDKFYLAVNNCLKRNPVLTVNFYQENEELFQRVNAPSSSVLMDLDISNHTYEEKEIMVQNFLRKEANIKLDPAEGELFKIILIRTLVGQYSLIIHAHQLVCDECGIENVMKEIGLYYNKPSDCKPLTCNEVNYLTLVSGQLSQFDRGKMVYNNEQNEKTYNIEFYFQGDMENISQFEGERLNAPISYDLRNNLKKLANREESTLFSVMLAAFHSLIFRFTPINDIATSCLISTRNFHESSQMTIGSFIINRTFKNTFEGGTPYLDVLKNVTSKYEQIHSTFNENNLNKVIAFEPNPPCNLSFNYESMLETQFHFQDLEVTEQRINYSITTSDVKFSIKEYSNELLIEVTYNNQKYQKQYIEQLLRSYLNFLQSISLNPSQRINSVPLLSKKEQDLQLSQWNQSDFQVSNFERIHLLFENQAHNTPNQYAIFYGEEKLTYKYVYDCSLHYYNSLLEQGVKPGNIFIIDARKSPSLISLILAIWKLGCSYVALDKNMPSEQVKNVIETICHGIIVKDNEKISYYDWSVSENFGTIYIEEDNDVNIRGSRKACELYNHFTDVAYITFTSGTTGTPKGVPTSHKSLSNYLYYLKEVYEISMDDRVLQIPLLSYDASVRDIFGTLSWGGILILPLKVEDRDPIQLVSLLKKHSVTSILSVVPSFAQLLVDEMKKDSNSSLQSLRLVLLSGEQLSLSLVNQLREYSNKQMQIVNQYGPTECTLTSTFYKVNVEEKRERLPIGKAIKNQKIYVLDSNYHPVPIGVKGDIYISGVGLSSGYFNNDDLTDRVFIENPHIKGEKMYVTGDLGFYSLDGNLNYLSRKDRELKISGNWINLNSIELSLLKLPHVKNAVIIFDQQNNNLVGYVTGEIPNLNYLTDYLKRTMPLHLVPQEFYKLDKIPLKTNGKVDYKSIKLEENKVKLDYSHSKFNNVQPVYKLEKDIQIIWNDILGKKTTTIGVDDDFFYQGGQSLIAFQIVSRMREDLGVNISVEDIFTYSTIHKLAMYVLENPHLLGKTENKRKIRSSAKRMSRK
ncbi:amino acid adenylation domain-containing protein [Bacillus thuringiensis]|uniref:non-ribosomal peptide synthetase n=1 Tax=Bacillus thuringiensis TaxID=1428 RepID=UPI00125EBB34|nr:non-ribosomal peptide synthetase [Bacillus thuringiensis]KAB5639412.1 amino acid adenylation domain-containing protein [Bacillus thuringiensis]HDR5271467.1 amino acid adenylation domain-containing protein [Bacillus thuringiensis]